MNEWGKKGGERGRHMQMHKVDYLLSGPLQNMLTQLCSEEQGDG